MVVSVRLGHPPSQAAQIQLLLILYMLIYVTYRSFTVSLSLK